MNILLVSPHADDSELGCGATISKLRTSATVWSVYFAPCTEDPKNVGHLEQHRKAVQLLGIDKLIEHSFPVNILEKYKQEIRDILWKLKEEFHPQLVFCPSLNDFHQDHKAVADCCQTIFRHSIILGYESVASCPNFSPNIYVKLSKSDVERKMKAVECYEAQLRFRSSYFRKDAILAQMKLRGAQLRVKWAEAFELIWGGIVW